MMEFSQIQELLKLVNDLNIAEFKLENGEFALSIRSKAYLEAKQAGNDGRQLQPAFPLSYMPPLPPMPIPPQVTPHISAETSSAPIPTTHPPVAKAETIATAADANLITIKSPMIGTFYRSPGPDKSPFVKVGDPIYKGSRLCIIEAMKLFNEIDSDISGTIVKVLAEDKSPVEYDQPLFLVQP